MLGLVGKKVGMTQIFEDGKLIPVTVISAGPNYVLQKKMQQKKDTQQYKLDLTKLEKKLCQNH